MRSVNGLCGDLPMPFKQRILSLRTRGKSAGLLQTLTGITSNTAARAQLPNLLLHCPFELRINQYCRQVSLASKKWMEDSKTASGISRGEQNGLNAGLLAAMCYPTVDYGQLRVCSDFITWLFYLRDAMDEVDRDGCGAKDLDVIQAVMSAFPALSSSTSKCDDLASKLLCSLTESLWTRLSKNAPPSLQRRLFDALQAYFHAAHRRASDERNHVHPDMESYINLRRITSGCKPCFLLIEYAHGMELPEYVRDDPIVRDMELAASDVVAWSNDIYSYNADQSRGKVHNLVAVVMLERSIDVQAAIDFVGELCISRMRSFEEDARCLPSWSHEVDRDVAVYVRGLQDWMIGSLHWSFETERYFGKDGDRVKMQRIVTLSSPRV